MQQQTTKKKLNKVLIFKWIMVFMMITLILFMPKIKEYVAEKKFEKKEREIIYCHFENNATDYGVNITQCINMKIISKEMHKIDLNQFNRLNYTSFLCTPNLDDIPDCHTENHYLSVYPIDLWVADNNTIDGFACIEYQINFTVNNRENILGYLSAFMQYTYPNQTEQREAFIECDGGY